MRVERIRHSDFEADQPYEIFRISVSENYPFSMNEIELKGKSGTIYLLTPQVGEGQLKEGEGDYAVRFNLKLFIGIFKEIYKEKKKTAIAV